MYPKILVKIGRGYDPIELQKSSDTDLKTEAKTVVEAINELYDSDNGEALIAGVSDEFTIDPETNVLRLNKEFVEKCIIVHPEEEPDWDISYIVAGNNSTFDSTTSFYGGIVLGHEAKLAGDGVAIGTYAEVVNDAISLGGEQPGVAIGMCAYTDEGVALGNRAKAMKGDSAFVSIAILGEATDAGIAIGPVATAKNLAVALGYLANARDGGGAIGEEAHAGSGFSGGKQAKVGGIGDEYIDAIQLGTGTNENEKTLQIYEYTLMNADGTIPSDRIPQLGDIETALDSIIAMQISSIGGDTV